MARKKPAQLNPAAQSLDYVTLKEDWDLITALLGGTRAMREAAETYLPRHAEEEDDPYTERLNSSVLYNGFEEAVDGVVSRVFAEPVIVKDEAAEIFKTHSEDMTGLGENLDGFARRVFQSAVSYGISYILVDFPNLAPEIEETTDDGETFVRPRTAADDMAEGVRPYWRLYPALNVPGVEIGPIGHGFGITRIRLSETRIDVDPKTFDETLVERVRVIAQDKWEVYEREQPDEASTATEGEDWKVVASGDNPLGYVPVIPVVLGRYHRPYLVKPPFLDLAYLNVRHWQSYSDQAGILAKTRFPMLAFKGDQLPVKFGAKGVPTDDGVLVVGPSTLLTGAANSQWYYVEPEGKGADGGFKDIERIEAQMQTLALVPFLAQRTGNVTATAKAIDSVQANSEVQAWALMFKDALEQSFAIHADWMDMSDEVTVHVNTDFGLSLGAAELTELIKLRAMGELSRRTLWLEAGDTWRAASRAAFARRFRSISCTTGSEPP